MGLGSFLSGIGNAAAGAVKDVSSGLNTVDRYINPFHVEQGSTKSGNTSGNSPLGNVVSHQVETVSQGMNWLYDNGVSQPLSTALMAGQLPGGPFSAHNWAQSWHAANHISPAQALFLNTSETQKAVNSPLAYYKPGEAYLPPDFDSWSEDRQQDFLKQAGMPAIGNRYIQELRQTHRYFANASGIGDFALRWWADPTILAGKAAGAARRELQVVRRPAAGWSGADIDKIMQKSTMTKAVDFIWQNRDNPQLLNNLSMAQHSAMGPRFGALASLLKSPDEVHDFLRIGLGDMSAIERLQTKNTLAGARVAQDTERVSALDLMATRYANAGDSRMTQMIQQQMDTLNDRINADTSLVRGYNNILDHAHELDQVNLSRWSFARAQDRTAAQAAYRAAPARGRLAGRSAQVTPTSPGKQILPLIPVYRDATPAGPGVLGGRAGLAKRVSTPMDFGFSKSRLYGVGDFFSSPVTVVRSFANARPNGYMRIDDIDKDSIAELRGQLARIPNITDQTRLNVLNEYLKTQTEGERTALLNQVGAMGAAKIAAKHGMQPEAGLDIYKEHLGRQLGEIDNMKRYSAATKPIVTPDGTMARVRVDEFATDGGKLVVHPNLVTRLANDHVFQDLGEMDKVLARHSSALSAIRTSRLGNPDWMLDASDYLTHMFKFSTLFRLGYIPRVMGDDLAGQWARAGAAAMAMRVGWGVRNGATNAALWLTEPMNAAKAAVARQGADYASEKLAEVQADAAKLRGQVQTRRSVIQTDLTVAGKRLAAAQAKRAAMDPAVTPPARLAAMDQLITKFQTAMDRASRSMGTGVAAKNMRLRDLEAHAGFLDRYRVLQQKAAADAQAKIDNMGVIQGSRPVSLGNGVMAPAAFGGKQGEYYQKLVSSDEALGQIFSTNKQLIHGHLMRSFDHGSKPISAAQDETLHATSWAHAINAQLMQDPLALQAVRGASPEDMTKWLTNSAEGRAYRQRLGLKVASNEDIANSVWHDVAEYMPTPEIRAKALEPAGVTPEFLKQSIPMVQRPEVHTGQVGGAQSRYKRALDDIVARWFKVASTIPADRMSRHPLFNQLYEGHLATLKNQLVKQGAFDTTVGGVEDMAKTARRLALRDTRGLVFDIAHRSDASAAMRFISPFMTATNESFQRWGRIIADKPQVAGYANVFFNGPIAAGHMQDADGNDITKDGYVYTIDPKTGKAVKSLVPKSQRYIVGRMPKWLVYTPLATALGIEPASRNFRLSQNSMNLVTQGDPWFSPGVGPIVQIPVNALVKDKPKAAELARQLQILPFGPQNGGAFGSGPVGEAAGFILPSTAKNFLTAFDTSDSRYQDIKLQIMQRAAYEHENLGKPMPSAKQIASMTRDYWLFSAASAFLQPMATQKADKYQFFRDQYNALRRQNPLTADDEYLKRFGESHFIFAQSQSKNDSGIPATMKAVELEKRYGDVIAKNPELGALIVGPEGNGPFSPEAYSYQLNTPITPGSSEMQRSKMSADEAMQENQRRLGWAKYTAMVTGLTKQLHDRGLKSFSDKGAEDLKQQKSNYTNLYSQPMYPDGTPNPYYNEAWSKDYSTLDPLKYERLIPGMTEIARSALASDPNRSDLRTLQQYLGGRQAVLQALQERSKAGGAKTLTAKANGDLAAQWQQFVDGLIESDTRFGDLHSRYLARDLGYDGSQSEAS